MGKQKKAETIENIYEVDFILKKRIIEGDTEYLVRWKSKNRKYL